MGLESGTYIDSLVATNPVGSDNRNQGDDHLRLIKNTVKASFPDVDEAVVTIHNGTSAPSNKQTGTVWRDTTASLWKYWNGSTWYVLPLAFNATSNLNISGNALISTDTDGDITITPNGSGEIVLDGQKWPTADGDNADYLTTNGSGQIAWTENTVAASVTSAAASATTATAQAVIATAKAVLTAADVVSCNAVLDTFDDRFLGSKSSAPTLDNDGDALADGALYFLTTTNVMYVYDLATTTWLQLTPTDAEQANINVVAGNILYKEDLGSIADALSTGSGSDISTVADSIADINRYAAEYVIASSTPTSPTPAEGDLWYDSTNNVLKYHNGSSFVSIAGGLASLAGDGSPQLAAALDCQNNNINNCGTVDGSNLQMDFGSVA